MLKIRKGQMMAFRQQSEDIELAISKPRFNSNLAFVAFVGTHRKRAEALS